MVAALAVSEPAVSETVPRMDVEFVAGEITGGDGVGAVCDQADAAGDSTGEEKREDAADERAEDGGGPQSDEDGPIGIPEAEHFVIAHGFLGEDEGYQRVEERGILGKYLVVQESKGLMGGLGCMEFVEALGLLLHGA
jgi:hypothetical protein